MELLNSHAVCLSMITRQDIEALIDKELGKEEADFVQRTIDNNLIYKRTYNQILDQKEKLKQWWHHNNKC